MPKALFTLPLLLLLASCRSAPESVEPSLQPPAEQAARAARSAARPWALPQPPTGSFSPSAEQVVEQYLESLSLEQKIGQRFLFGIPGTRVGERTRRLVREGYPGRRAAHRAEHRRPGAARPASPRSCRSWRGQNHPPIGLLVAVDQEGGRVSRLDLDRLEPLPPAPRLGRLRGPLLHRGGGLHHGARGPPAGLQPEPGPRAGPLRPGRRHDHRGPLHGGGGLRGGLPGAGLPGRGPPGGDGRGDQAFSRPRPHRRRHAPEAGRAGGGRGDPLEPRLAALPHGHRGQRGGGDDRPYPVPAPGPGLPGDPLGEDRARPAARSASASRGWSSRTTSRWAPWPPTTRRARS